MPRFICKRKRGGGFNLRKVDLINIRTGSRKVQVLDVNAEPKKSHAYPLSSDWVPPGLNDDNSLPEPTKTYLDVKIQELQSWEHLRPHLLKAAVESLAVHGEKCFLCESKDAPYRCQDCSPMALCYDCVITSHKLQPLHCVEKAHPPGIYLPFKFPGFRVLTSPELSVSQGVLVDQEMTLIDEKGRTHFGCSVLFLTHGNEKVDLPRALVKLGFWPMTPSPRVAVSMKLLSLLQCLTLECHVSAQGFVSAVDEMNHSFFKKSSKLKAIQRGETLPEFRLLWQKMHQGPISVLPELQNWLGCCPACSKEDDGTKVISFDGNFGLVLKSNSGHLHPDTSDIKDLYFLDQEKVDSFVDGYYQDTKDSNEECSQFQAGDIIRSKNQTTNLRVTGVFGSACRHEVPLLFMDLRHGERLSYPVYLLKELRRLSGTAKLQILYDIACVLTGHLKKRHQLQLIEKVQLAIPVFHSYGHRGECQVTMNPRKMSGFGLTDGEQMERLWAYLRPFSKITKEQTPVHRKQLLTMALLHYAQRKADVMGMIANTLGIEQYLGERLTKADEMFDTAESSLAETLQALKEFKETENVAELIEQIKEDEKTALRRRREARQRSSWKEVYANELIRYTSLQGQLRSVNVSDRDIIQLTSNINESNAKLRGTEGKHKIIRWKLDSVEFQEQIAAIQSRRLCQILRRLRYLAAESYYQSYMLRTNADGQAKAARILVQIKSNSQHIRNTVKTYNVAAADQQPGSVHPTSLKVEDVRVGSVIFDSLEPQGSTDVPPSLCRKMVDAWDMKKRSLEENNMVLQEIAGTYKHFGRLQCELQDILSDTESGGWYELGVHCLVLNYMIILQARLKRMHKRFSTKKGIDIPSPPDIQLDISFPEEPDNDEEEGEEGEYQEDENSDTEDKTETPATIDVEVMIDNI